MVTFAVFILLFSGLCSLSSGLPRRYHFVNMSKTWTDAQTHCRETYTDLASFNNMDEVEMTMNQTWAFKTQAWIGLYRTDWKWSQDENITQANGNVEFSNWAQGEPGGNEDCVLVFNGKWYDAPCSYKHKFACSQEQSNTSKNITVIDQKNCWTDAQKYCRNNYTDLASVRNQEENMLLQGIDTKDYTWIGLFKEWRWSDQSNSSFRYWMSGQSRDLNCTVASLPGPMNWTTRQCNEHLPFLCYENKLVLIHEKGTWKEALEFCRENYLDLVSVTSAEIQGWVKELTPNATTDNVWLGLSYGCSFDVWYWVSGETAECYENWAPGRGNERQACGAGWRTGAIEVHGDQKWVALPSTEKLNFICIRYEDE